MEVRINSTKAKIEEFKDSILWKDICRELDFWIEGFDHERDSLVDRIASENLTSAAALTLEGSIDGRKKSAEYFKGILDMFINILEDKDANRSNSTD